MMILERRIEDVRPVGIMLMAVESEKCRLVQVGSLVAED
jgi:hypothetical protein